MQKNEQIQMLFSRFNTLLLTRKQVAKILNVSTQTVDRMRKQGHSLPHIQIKRQIRYSIIELVDYCERNKIKIF